MQLSSLTTHAGMPSEASGTDQKLSEQETPHLINDTSPVKVNINDTWHCAYECCCEERCSVIDIANGKCPASKSTTTNFPYLAAPNLNKNEKKLLRGHIQRQFQEITMRFADLVESVQESLNRRGVEAKVLTRKVMYLKGYISHNKSAQSGLLQNRIQEMREAKTTDDIFDILHDYVSFFSYTIIEHIVDKLGTEADRENLQTYKSHFTEYCRRSVFQCPFSICSKNSEHFVDLVMKVVSDSMTAPYSMNVVELFQGEVFDQLHLSKHTLKLCSVEEGCLQLTFQMPGFLTSFVFPLNADQVKGLRKLGVTELVCNGVSQLKDFVSVQTSSTVHDTTRITIL